MAGTVLRGPEWVPKNPQGQIDPTGGSPFDLKAWNPKIPLLLLPVRLETAYVSDTDPAELRIRILPDPASVAGAAPASVHEIEEAQDFWTRYHAAAGPKQRSATWRQYVRRLGSARAGYVARLTRPAIDADGRLSFPEIDPEADGQALAALLPTRWMATGWVGEMVAFQVFSRSVSGPLATSPNPNMPAAKLADSGLVIDPSTAWLFDYSTAVERGMAITVPLTGRAKMAADGVSTLIVIGVDENQKPTATVEELTALFDQHSRSAGLAFVPQGTPTNNTVTVEAGYRRAETEMADLEARELGAYRPHSHDNASRLTRALGVPDPEMFGRLAHGADREYTRSQDMRIALFETILGTFCRHLLAPHAKESDTLGTGLDKTIIGALRSWFVQWVTGGAPVPSLRIGRQPYGILPVMVGTGVDHATEPQRTLAGVIDLLIQEWRSAAAAVPTLDHNATDAVNDDPDLADAEARDTVTAVLANNPHPRRLAVRTAVDWADQPPPFGVGTRGAARVKASPTGQPTIDRAQIEPIPIELVGGYRWEYDHALELRDTRYEYTLKPLYDGVLQEVVQPRPIPGQIDTPGIPPGGRIVQSPLPRDDDDIRDIEQQIEIWTQLDDSIDNGFVLAEEIAEFFPEFHAFARDVIAQLERHELRQRPLRWLVIPKLDGVLGRDELQLLLTRFYSNQRLWQRAVVQDDDPSPGLAANDYLLNLSDRVGSPVVIPPTRPPNAPLLYQLLEATLGQGGDKASRRNALRRLAAIDPTQLDWLLRETLGLGSHRLDAWHTSLATARLSAMRDEQPQGLYVGAFGFVVDLVRSDQRPSHGFIHAPSLAHAASAAVLRAGWLARGNNDNASPAAVDLASGRVREADWLMSGVRHGQELGDLLGTRFERALHDARLDAAIRPMREAVAEADGLGEASADQPVDGIRLLDLHREGRLDVPIDGLALSSNGERQLRRLLDALAAAFDAIDDATTFEMVHQLVVGNLERAAAVVDSMGPNGGRPPELLGLRTPRGALTIDTRALVLIEVDPENNLSGWRGGTRDRFDTALEGWVASLLPSPAEISWLGVSPAGEDIPLKLDRVEISALDALFMANDDPRAVSPALRRLVELAYPDQEFDSFRTTESGGASTTLAELQLLAVELRRLIQESTPADARSLAGAEQMLTHTIDAGDTIGSAEQTLGSLFEVFDIVTTATAWSDLNPQEAAELARIGLTPSPTVDPASDFAALQQRLVHRRQRADAVVSPDTLEGMRKRVAAVVGGGTPLLTPFTVPADGAVAFSPALADADTIDDWLDLVGTVRPNVGSLTRVVLFSGLLGVPPPPVIAGQLPLLDGDAWAAMRRPSPGTGGRVAVAAVTHGTVAPMKSVVGLVIDQWSERIPADNQVTGVTMHVDAPSTEAPQTMLLVVPPAGRQWSSDLILDTLLETIEWAQLRCVAIDDLGDYGHALPTAFVPGDLDEHATQGGTS